MESVEMFSAIINATVSGTIFIGVFVMILAHWMF